MKTIGRKHAINEVNCSQSHFVGFKEGVASYPNAFYGQLFAKLVKSPRRRGVPSPRCGMLLGVAAFTACRTFLHLAVAFLTLLVGNILAETGNLSTFSFFMALLAVLQSLGMCLVIEGHPFFHLHYVGSKCCSGKNGYCQGCNDNFLHVHVSFVLFFCALRSSQDSKLVFERQIYHSEQDAVKAYL